MLVTSAVPDPQHGCCEGERRQGESPGAPGCGRGALQGCDTALRAGEAVVTELSANE